MNSRTDNNDKLTNWLNEIYQEGKKPGSLLPTLTIKGSAILGGVIGAASAYIMYLLSAEFGENVCNYLAIHENNQKSAVINTLGLTAAIPMAALSALNVKDSLTSFIKYFTKSKTTCAPPFKKKTSLELAARGFFAVSAPFSSIPQSTLTWSHLTNPEARIFFTACSVIGPTFFNGRGGQKLIDNYRPKSSVVLELEAHLHKCHALLKKMPHTSFLPFLQKITNSDGQLNNEFLNELFALSDGDHSAHEKEIAKTLISFSGGFLGLISAIIFFQLSMQGLQNSLQLNDPISLNFISSLAYILNAALSSLATRHIFENIYEILFKRACDRNKPDRSKTQKIFIFIAILIGPFAALPLGSQQIANARDGSIWQKLLIGPTFLGPACVRSKALYDLLNRCLDFIVMSFQQNSKIDPSLDTLLNTIEQFSHSINELDSETINSLQEIRIRRQNLPA